MGNQGNCRSCLQASSDDGQKQQKQNSLTIDKFPVQCLICRQSMEQSKFKEHLDLQHYALIEQKSQKICVSCLLCGNISSSLEKYSQHLSGYHNYNKSSKNIVNQSRFISNEKLKKQVKNISDLSKIRILIEQKVDEMLIEYDNKQMKCYTYSKQYQGIDYAEEMVEAQLIWYNIFTKHCQATKYYHLQCKAYDSTIKCKSYIIIQNV